jgi:hypothetical protein
MSNKKKFIFIILVLGALVASYFLFFKMTKEKALKIIVAAKEGRVASTYSGFGDDFLIEWAKAIKKNSPDFTLNGKMYDTLTGKSK